MSPVNPADWIYRETRVPWDEEADLPGNAGQPIKTRLELEPKIIHRRHPVVLHWLEFFFGTYAEQWMEATVVARLVGPRGVKLCRLGAISPHKHASGRELRIAVSTYPQDSHRIRSGLDSKEFIHGCYYDAKIIRQVGPPGRGILAPPFSRLHVSYRSAEMKRGIDLAVGVYGEVQRHG